MATIIMFQLGEYCTQCIQIVVGLCCAEALSLRGKVTNFVEKEDGGVVDMLFYFEWFRARRHVWYS